MALDAAVLQHRWEDLTPAVVDALHAAGVAIWTWPVDDPDAVARSVAMGADGIIGDDVPLLLEARRPGRRARGGQQPVVSVADGPAAVPPLVVLIDFDGTIARADVSDEVMYRFVDRDAWAPLEAAYLRGDIGSRTLLTGQAALLDGDTTEIARIGETEELDPHFIPFVAAMRERGIPIEVVSDGFGFFVRPALERMNLADLQRGGTRLVALRCTGFKNASDLAAAERLGLKVVRVVNYSPYSGGRACRCPVARH